MARWGGVVPRRASSSSSSHVDRHPPRSRDFDEEPRLACATRWTPRATFDSRASPRRVRGRSLDFDGTAAGDLAGGSIDLATTPFTISAPIHTTKDAPSRWTSLDGQALDGATFFSATVELPGTSRVDALEGEAGRGRPVDHVAVTNDPGTGTDAVGRWRDGCRDRRAEGATPDHVLSVGFTNVTPRPNRSEGYSTAPIHRGVLRDRAAIRAGRRRAASRWWSMTSRVRGPGPRDRRRPGGGDGRRRCPVRGDRRRRGPAGLEVMAAPYGGAGRCSRPAAVPFAVDRVDWPADNPWRSWMRFGDFDFLDGEGSRDQHLERDVGGSTGSTTTSTPRVASRRDVEQPAALLRLEATILVVSRPDHATGRPGRRSRDRSLRGVQRRRDEQPALPRAGERTPGRTGRFALLHQGAGSEVSDPPRHGTFVRGDGRVEVWPAACPRRRIDADGIAWGSDQKAPMPANRINRIEPGSFHGTLERHAAGPRAARHHDLPPLWIHPSVDRSPRAAAVPDGTRELSGVGCSVPTTGEVPRPRGRGRRRSPGSRPAGRSRCRRTMRGRFHPDGSLYVAGLSVGRADQTDPGGSTAFAGRPRTGGPDRGAAEAGLRLEFCRSPRRSMCREAFRLEGWNYRWSSDYGSPQLDSGRASPDDQLDHRRRPLRGPEDRPARDPRDAARDADGPDWELEFEDVGTRSSFVTYRTAFTAVAARLRIEVPADRGRRKKKARPRGRPP